MPSALLRRGCERAPGSWRAKCHPGNLPAALKCPIAGPDCIRNNRAEITCSLHTPARKSLTLVTLTSAAGYTSDLPRLYLALKPCQLFSACGLAPALEEEWFSQQVCGLTFGNRIEFAQRVVGVTFTFLEMPISADISAPSLLHPPTPRPWGTQHYPSPFFNLRHHSLDHPSMDSWCPTLTCAN